MPLQKIVNGFNKLKYYAVEKDFKNSAAAINEISAAFFEFQADKYKRNIFKIKLKEIFEILKAGRYQEAIQVVGALGSAFEIINSSQNMGPFQLLIGALCIENWKPEHPANKVLGFGMLNALEHGLRGDCGDSTPEKILESSKAYENKFYICPIEMFAINYGMGASFDDIYPVVTSMEMLKNSIKNHGPMKVFMVDQIRKGFLKLLEKARRQLDINDKDTFEGLVAISYKFGLLYFARNPEKARALAAEFRMPNPF